MNQTAPPLNATQYAAELFPKLTSEDAGTIAELYAGLGSAVAQDNRIMGEGVLHWSPKRKVQLTSPQKPFSFVLHISSRTHSTTALIRSIPITSQPFQVTLNHGYHYNLPGGVCHRTSASWPRCRILLAFVSKVCIPHYLPVLKR